MRLKRLLGYTLGEIVTTVAVVGTLTAIAIPNYLRIKMNVNMEMVKQHLRVIGEELDELYAKNDQYVEEANWDSGVTPEELSITANLNGIWNKGYTRNEYVTNSSRSYYRFRTCPQVGRWGISGDRCFLLEHAKITEIELWEGFDPGFFAMHNLIGYGPDPGNPTSLYNYFGADPPTRADVEKFLLDHARYHYSVEQSSVNVGLQTEIYNTMTKFSAYTDPAVVQTLQQYLSDPSFYNGLANQGVQVGLIGPTAEEQAAGVGLLGTITFTFGDNYQP